MNFGSRGQYNPYYRGGAIDAAAGSTLMQRVSYLLCTALIVTAVAAFIGQGLSPALALPFGIGTIVCVIALSFTRTNPGLSLILLYALSTMEGLMMGPIISALVRGYPLGGTIVGEAAGLSAIIIGGLGTFVWITSKDFGYLGKSLFWVLLGLIVVGFIAMFVPMFQTAPMQLLYSLAIVAVFVGFTLYDFSNIKLRYGPNDYIVATVALYLDFLNLFWAILRILMILSGGGGRRR